MVANDYAWIMARHSVLNKPKIGRGWRAQVVSEILRDGPYQRTAQLGLVATIPDGHNRTDDSHPSGNDVLVEGFLADFFLMAVAPGSG
jgi:hypothetical protein